MAREREETIRVVMAEVRSHGYEPVLIRNGHLKLRWWVNGRQWTYAFSCTPGDVRHRKNTLAGVRRMLRESTSQI